MAKKKIQLTEEELKVCSKCQIYKEQNEFNRHSIKYPLLKPYCKACQKIYDSEYRKSHDGLITELFKSLKSSSKSRRHTEINFCKLEFVEWLKQNNYQSIYNDGEIKTLKDFLRPLLIE